MPNFKLQKCDETDRSDRISLNIAQSIWSKTGLLVAVASKNAFMPRL